MNTVKVLNLNHLEVPRQHHYATVKTVNMNTYCGPLEFILTRVNCIFVSLLMPIFSSFKFSYIMASVCTK